MRSLNGNGTRTRLDFDNESIAENHPKTKTLQVQ